MERTLSSGTSSSARVLGIPELVNLIASYVSRPDVARISRVCRWTFEILIPRIWKHVKGAQNLLSLIKSASFHYDESNDQLQEIVCIVLNIRREV